MRFFLGKTDRRVLAVFATNVKSAEVMVGYLKSNLDLPIWLFSTVETGVACDREIVGATWWRVQRELWPYKVALAVTEWDHTRGNWMMKTAPFTVPFFRALVRNVSGGFFAGSPKMVWHYASLAIRRWFDDRWTYFGELCFGSVLWVFAFIAQWNSALSRAVFRRVRGTERLVLTPDLGGEGITVYRHPPREWNARQVSELKGRYALFQLEGDETDAAELLPYFIR